MYSKVAVCCSNSLLCPTAFRTFFLVSPEQQPVDWQKILIMVILMSSKKDAFSRFAGSPSRSGGSARGGGSCCLEPVATHLSRIWGDFETPVIVFRGTSGFLPLIVQTPRIVPQSGFSGIYVPGNLFHLSRVTQLTKSQKLKPPTSNCCPERIIFKKIKPKNIKRQRVLAKVRVFSAGSNFFRNDACPGCCEALASPCWWPPTSHHRQRTHCATPNRGSISAACA